MTSQQPAQADWRYQWEVFEDDGALTLFKEWIHPQDLDDFSGKTVLDAGCGGGQHMGFVAPYAAEVVGADLNCAELAADRCAHHGNTSTVTADIATMNLGRQFDVVYCVGVLHHTDDPRASFANIARHVRPGGRLIVWVYSHEGNLLNRTLVEGLKRRVFGRWPKPILLALSHLLTALLYVPVYSVYLLPLPFLPYYRYFQNFRRLPHRRNLLNVFDKLNAPQTVFLNRQEVEGWFSKGFEDVHVSDYVGVSWRASGTRL